MIHIKLNSCDMENDIIIDKINQKLKEIENKIYNDIMITKEEWNKLIISNKKIDYFIYKPKII